MSHGLFNSCSLLQSWQLRAMMSVARLQYSSHASPARAPPMVDFSNPIVDDIALVCVQAFQDVALVLSLEEKSQSAQKAEIL